MVVPLALNSQSAMSLLAPRASAPRRRVSVVPLASPICEPRVRCQISRYTLSSVALSSLRRLSGDRSGSVGRIASWASWAFFTLLL